MDQPIPKPTRDEAILAAADSIIRTRGLSGLTRQALARSTGWSTGSISNFGLSSIQNSPNPPDGFRTRILAALMAGAVRDEDVTLLRVGLVDGCLKEADVPASLRGVLGL